MYPHGSITVESCIPMVHFSHHEKNLFFCMCETKAQISCVVSMQLIRAFVFAT